MRNILFNNLLSNTLQLKVNFFSIAGFVFLVFSYEKQVKLSYGTLLLHQAIYEASYVRVI